MRGGARAEFEPTLLDKRELDKVIEGLPFPTLAIDTAQELEFRLEATQIQVQNADWVTDGRILEC